MKTVAVLGAGHVSRPLVRYLLDRGDLRVVVADQVLEKAAALVAGHPDGDARVLDARDEPALDALVARADLVVSLLPAGLHAPIARLALRHGTDMVTTSYVSPAMAALDAEARAAGVLVLCECGLDPGLDHMSAMRAIARIRAEGSEVVGLWSTGGGLPAPESDTTPWHYKFSWSPRGVLVAAASPARFLEDGTVHEVPAGRIFERVVPVTIEGVGPLEVHPNRDALPYAAAYGVPGVRGIYRGTFRHPSWNETLRAAGKLGLLDAAPNDWPPGTTCSDVTARLLPAAGNVRGRVALALGLDAGHAVLERLAWAGLLSQRPVAASWTSPLDMLCALLQERLLYGPGERDMIILEHRIRSERPDGTVSTSRWTLVVFGEPGGDSAMARTVALPAAIAARLRLEGRLGLSGVRIPVEVEIYEPVLDELAKLGIRFRESTG